jgi:hypothetical protein
MKSLNLLAVAAVVACSDSFTPTIENVSGVYALRTLTTVTDTGGTKDWVAAGASFTITLAPDGSTTGHLLIPGGGENGGDLDADMAGTWTLSRAVVEFDQGADSFVRDWPFSVLENQLTVDRTPTTGLRVVVVLTK